MSSITSLGLERRRRDLSVFASSLQACVTENVVKFCIIKASFRMMQRRGISFFANLVFSFALRIEVDFIRAISWFCKPVRNFLDFHICATSYAIIAECFQVTEIVVVR